MNVVLFFGQLKDYTQQSKIEIGPFDDTAELKGYLLKEFPKMKSINFQMAINSNIVEGNVRLMGGEEIALLPPFS